MDKFITYNRYINNDRVWKRKKWEEKDVVRKIDYNYCHFGQLKLFFTELEFLTICLQNNIDLHNSTIVYVGAAPGTHIKHLQRLFPNMYWILYDPNPFHIQRSNYVDIFNDYFTDDSIPLILNHSFVNKTKYLLFISDIRVSPTEQQVFDDMIKQQRWLIYLSANMSMLKFRLPYTISTGQKTWTYSFDDVSDKIDITDTINGSDYMLNYLDGNLYTQLYPPVYSTETRLIVANINNDKYKLTSYDTVKYEEQCYYYNTNIRHKHMTYKKSHLLKYHIIGMIDNYETCSQYYMIEQYLLTNNRHPDVKTICNILYDIYIFYNSLITKINTHIASKNLIVCPLLSVWKEKIISVSHFRTVIKDKNLTKEDITILKRNLNKLYRNMIIYTNEQIKNFESSNLLDNHQYSTQIQILRNSIKTNNILIDNINDCLTEVIKFEFS